LRQREKEREKKKRQKKEREREREREVQVILADNNSCTFFLVLNELSFYSNMNVHGPNSEASSGYDQKLTLSLSHYFFRADPESFGFSFIFHHCYA
jgi:hypothetical protein